MTAVDEFWNVLSDTQSVSGRVVASGLVVAIAVIVALIGGRVLARRADDAQSRYYARKVVRYVVAGLTLFLLAAMWRAFAGRAGVVLGLAAAGLAFAMQEVVGAVAGWFNILSGRIFRVGDRIQMGGVRGDVIDITPLRTKVMEIGSGTDDKSWVQGRQFTGRVVAISNKATFTEPVFNYSAVFNFLWEELTMPVAFDADWDRATEILEEEAVRVSVSVGAIEAITTMRRRYPVPAAEVEPRVFATPTDTYLRLSARFIVPVRAARTVKDDLTRRVLERFAEEDIEVAAVTKNVRVDLHSDTTVDEQEA